MRFEVTVTTASGAGVTTTDATGFPAPNAIPALLPEGQALCGVFGLDAGKPGQCTAAAVLTRAAQQTDPALWFSRSELRVGAPPAGCLGAKPFDNYRTRTGTTGTTYLCLAPPGGDTIGEDELTRVRARARQLNEANPPTLADYRARLTLKHDLEFYARP